MYYKYICGKNYNWNIFRYQSCPRRPSHCLSESLSLSLIPFLCTVSTFSPSHCQASAPWTLHFFHQLCCVQWCPVYDLELPVPFTALILLHVAFQILILIFGSYAIASFQFPGDEPWLSQPDHIMTHWPFGIAVLGQGLLPYPMAWRAAWLLCPLDCWAAISHKRGFKWSRHHETDISASEPSSKTIFEVQVWHLRVNEVSYQNAPVLCGMPLLVFLFMKLTFPQTAMLTALLEAPCVL